MIEIWVAFGTGKDLRYVPAHDISASLGPRKSLALPVFHAFTDCDTVSHFAHVGKKTARKVWDTHDEVTAAFCELRGAPEEVADEVYSALGRFTILMYDRTSRFHAKGASNGSSSSIGGGTTTAYKKNSATRGGA